MPAMPGRVWPSPAEMIATRSVEATWKPSATMKLNPGSATASSRSAGSLTRTPSRCT